MGAQGLKGEVKVKIFTATPDALPRYGALHAKDGRTFTIALPGRFNVRNALAALGVARALGIGDAVAAEGLAAVPPSPAGWSRSAPSGSTR